MTREQAIKFALEKCEGSPASIRDIRLMLAEACGVLPDDVFFALQEEILDENFKVFLKYLSQYLARKPVSKILGFRYFWKNKFFVNEDVLDPRQDSETLIEAVLDFFEKSEKLSILDLGTGSGCLIISLLDEFKSFTGVGIDISEKALLVAQKNADSILGTAAEKLKFLHQSILDFAQNFSSQNLQKFDIIVSNPPYIPSDEISNLDDNVKLFDPKIALDGGEDGLKFYQQIANICPKILKDGGFVFLEIGRGQDEQVVQIFNKKLKYIDFRNDINSIKRVLIFKKI